MNEVTTKKTYFGYFCRFVTCALTLDCEICISTFSWHSLVFANFKQLPVGFRG